MNRIKKKLRSQTGASLTFALLLFLVCAVVGSVVLTAGTAAAGRMSKITEMDQRFYSVNSAARLLIELIDDKPVTIIETRTKDETQVTTYKYVGDTTVDSDSFSSIVKHAAYYYITHAEDELVSDLGLTMTLKPSEEYKAALSSNISEKIIGRGAGNTSSPFGTIVLKIENADGEDKYAMDLTFAPDVKKTVNDQETQTVTTWKITWYIQDAKVNGDYARVVKSS